MDKRFAFTLIELLVVIAVIGILSGLIVVSMSGTTDKARIAKAQVFSNSLRNSLMSNLISEWRFDGIGLSDGSTVTTAYTQDSWGSNNANGITGTPLIYSGSNCVFGSCLYFDGLSYLNGSISVMTSKTTYTIEGWVKIPTTVPGSNVRYMIELNGSYVAFSPCYYNSYRSLIYLNSGNYKYFGTDLRDEKWHHLVYIVNGTVAADIVNSKMYIDGSMIDAYSTNSSTAPLFPNGNFYIGNGAYLGYIDDIRIYDVNLSLGQTKENYYLGLNSLLKNGGISKEEYSNRINQLAYE